MRSIFFVLTATIFFSSCWDKTDNEYNDVHIRLENLTGSDLTNLTIGSRVYKSGGLDFVDFVHRFEELKNDQITQYFDTQGKFKGYSSVRGHIDGQPITWESDQKTEAFLANGAYEDSWENPFSDKFWDGLSLEKGNYTFKIRRHEDIRFFEIDIIEE